MDPSQSGGTRRIGTDFGRHRGGDCRLPGFHGNPADRIIVATARLLGVPLITADEKILRWNEKHNLLQVLEP